MNTGKTAVCIALSLAVSSVNATTILVPSEQPTIQAGIDAAIPGDTVLVADGTYTGDGNRDIDLGGKSIVLRSENGPDLTIIDCQGSASDPHRGFYFHSGEDSTTVVEGFTVQGGFGPYDSDGESVGGGIKCDSSSSPTLVDCILHQNYFGLYGGGLYCEDASPTLINCTFSNNVGHYTSSFGFGHGSGMYCINSSSVLVNCTFSDNIAAGFAYGSGGLTCESSNLTLVNCTFTGNYAGGNFGSGGGIYSIGSSLTAVGCTFSHNGANYGGAIYCSAISDTITLTNCIFIGNSAYDDTPPEGGWGGAIYCAANSMNLTNCTFSGNGGGSSGYHTFGGGMYIASGSVSLENCIIAFSQGAEAIRCVSPPALTCCNIYGNGDGDWIGCISNQAGINGNFSADPLFCDSAAANLHLNSASPCAPGNNDCETLIGALDVGCDCCLIGGDVDYSGGIDIADITYFVAFMFTGGPSPPCLEEADIDGSGTIDISDLTYMVDYLFRGGPAPPGC